MNSENGNLPSNQSKVSDDLELLRCARRGNPEALNVVLARYRSRLKKMISLRMNPRLRSRLDASDVIQDTLVEATRTVDQYLSNPKLSVYIWLRELANEKLIQAHRFHLNTQKRDVSREMSIYGNALSATSEAIAVQLVARDSTPSEAAVKNDRKRLLTEALEKMTPIDREVLTLKHFEHLNSKEAARILGLKHEAVKKRYIRALERLQRILVNE